MDQKQVHFPNIDPCENAAFVKSVELFLFFYSAIINLFGTTMPKSLSCTLCLLCDLEFLMQCKCLVRLLKQQNHGYK